jgi:hypothetical protein
MLVALQAAVRTASKRRLILRRRTVLKITSATGPALTNLPFPYVSSLSSTINLAVLSPQLAKIPLYALLAVFEGLVWCGAITANGKQIQKRAKQECHPTDCQRQHQGTHVKIPKRII